MALELLSLVCSFENCTKCSIISFDSDPFRIARGVSLVSRHATATKHICESVTATGHFPMLCEARIENVIVQAGFISRYRNGEQTFHIQTVEFTISCITFVLNIYLVCFDFESDLLSPKASKRLGPSLFVVCNSTCIAWNHRISYLAAVANF